MWLRDEIRKYKHSRLFKITGMFINMGESIVRYMKEEGASQKQIDSVMKKFQAIENQVIGD